MIQLDDEIIFKIPNTKIDLIVCSVEYVIINNEPVIILFARDRLMNAYRIPVYGFRPYFYIEKKDLLVFDSLGLFKDQLDYEIVDYSGFGSSDNLAKIYTKIPKDVELYREIKYPNSNRRIKTWEADVLFPLRYLIDNSIKTGIRYDPENNTVTPIDQPSRFRRLYVDIETLSDRSPDVKDFNDKVIVIGCFDSLTERYTIFSLKNPTIDLSTIIQSGSRIDVRVFRSEELMLSSFRDFVRNLEVDIFLSFTEFDWIYLFNRMRKLKIDTSRTSTVNVATVNEYRVKIHGIQFMDIQTLYFEKFLRGSKWETLHEIAHRELNTEKLYREESVYDNWFNDHNRVIARNLRDVEIIKRLDYERDLVTYFDTIRRIVGCNLSDSIYKSRIADVLYLRYCHNKLALPTKSHYKKVPYEGAVVHSVTPGIYHNIAVFDWSSMYPNIMITFNISFETLTVRNFDDMTFNIDDKYYFFRSPEGVCIKLLKELMPLRDPYKKLLRDPNISVQEKSYYKAVSDGIKSIINSIYGVFALSGDEDKIKAFRLYNPYVASAITYIGRKLELDVTMPICRELSYDVIYFDTDSVFIKMESNDIGKCNQLEEVLNSRIRDYIKSKWDVDPSNLTLVFDKFYDTLILFSKKRYVGREINGKLDVKGLEIIRKNSSDISGEIQEKISLAVFDHKSREEIIEIIRDFVRGFKDRPLEQIGIPQNLSKDLSDYRVRSAHLKAFEFSNKVLGMKLINGRRFWTVYVKDRDDTDMVAWDQYNPLPESIINIIDYDKMIEKTIRDKIDGFLDMLKIDWYSDILCIEDPKITKTRNAWRSKIDRLRLNLVVDQDKYLEFCNNGFKCPDHGSCPCKGVKKGECTFGLFKPIQRVLQ